MTLEVLDLSDVDPGSERELGGKACGLARLAAAGANVPPGFAVSATASSPAEWTEEERSAVLQRATELLAGGALAVRSSAVGEDSCERSFAGLLVTELRVSDLDRLLNAAARCIASGAAPQVLAYAGVTTAVPVGLVVQRMVTCRAAGVCFTRDPGGQDGAVVVEAVTGSGEDLVSGAREPDRWRVYWSGTGVWECRADADSGVLDQPTAAAIASAASALADLLGEPLDLEWALDPSDTLWWLQARPITAATSPAKYVIQRSCSEADDGPVTVWSNWNVRETMPEPLLPLTWSVWQEVILPVVLHQVTGVPTTSPLNRHLFALDQVHGRIYFNMNGLLAAPILGRLARHTLSVVDSEAGDVVRSLTASGVLVPRRLPGSALTRAPRMVMAGVLGALRFAGALRPRRSLRILEEDGRSISRRTPVAELADRDLVEEMRLWAGPECRRLLYGLQMEAVAMAVYGLATRLFRSHPEAVQRLATGIPGNPTTEISLAVARLVEAARCLAETFAQPWTATELLQRLELQPAGRQWLVLFEEFLSEFGHRGPMEFDLGAPRWCDEPSMVLELVRAGLVSSQGSIAERMARLGRERSRSVEAAVAASPRWKRPVLRWTARLVELYMPLREAPKHYGLLVFDRARRAALELGRRLVLSGALEDPDDVFYLELAELQAVAEGRGVAGGLRTSIAERRGLHFRFLAVRAPDFLRSDGVPVVGPGSSQPGPEDALKGTPVSAGRASGPVRVLSAPDPRAMSDRDVIVMRFADPGWTPLFPRAAAVVMEVGGLMCHAAVVAREMGVPAVFGVHDATRILRDGELVEVDGTLGLVTRV